MIVTKLEAVTKTKYRVFIDEQFAFALYKGELSHFQIKEDTELSENTLSQIHELLVKRAKLRAMHLLNVMARTEDGLRQKLLQNGYPKEAVEQAIHYVKSFGYINDEAYIRNFIDSRREKKSKKEIEALLIQKGIKGEMVDGILEDVYEEHSEREAIEEILRKKRWNFDEADVKDKQKMYGYLLRKGFRYEDIRQVLQVSNEDA